MTDKPFAAFTVAKRKMHVAAPFGRMQYLDVLLPMCAEETCNRLATGSVGKRNYCSKHAAKAQAEQEAEPRNDS